RPTAERVTLYARHDGRGAGVDRLQHPVEPQRVLDVLFEGEVDRRALPLDVGARAEAGAVPGENDGARLAHLAECVAQLADQRGVERVPPLRLRDRDAEEAALAFGPERAH